MEKKSAQTNSHKGKKEIDTVRFTTPLGINVDSPGEKRGSLLEI